MPMTNGGAQGTQELAKWLLTIWQWTFALGVTDFCLPSLSMLNIGQFLDEAVDVKDCAAWLLAYTRALQCVGEAVEGKRWCPNGMHFSMQVLLLVDAFIIEMGAELTEMEITSCWSQGAAPIPLQKKDGPFADIIAFLDELVRHELSRRVWDELMFPPLLSEEGTPCRSQHLGHILGQIIDLGNSLPAFQFRIMELDGEFVGVTRGLLFKGHLLTYDPMYNVTEWDLVLGMAADLSPTEDSSAWELSNITLRKVLDDVPRMEQFGEWCTRPTPVAVSCAKTGTQEEETGQAGFPVGGGWYRCIPCRVPCRVCADVP